MSPQRGSRGSCEICCRGRSGRETRGRSQSRDRPVIREALRLQEAGLTAPGLGRLLVQPCPWPWSSGNPAAACVSPCPLRLRVNHGALSSPLSALVSGQIHVLSSGPGHPHAEQACVPPLGPGPSQSKAQSLSSPPSRVASPPAPRSEAGPAAAEVKRPEEAVGRPRPGQGGQAERSLGGTQQGTYGARPRMGPGGEAALRNGRALRGTGRFQRRHGLDWAVGVPRLQDGPCTHTLTWVPLDMVTTEKPAWPPL